METSEVSVIDDVRLLALYRYWRQQAAGRRMPGRPDIDPAHIPSLLPYLMLTDVLGEGLYRYRLIGTEISAEQGIPATGRLVHEVLRGDDYRNYVIGLYDEVVRSRTALYTDSIFLSPKDGTTERHTKRLMLPLSADGEKVNIVLLGQVFFYIDHASRNRHFIDARPFRETVHVLL